MKKLVAINLKLTILILLIGYGAQAQIMKYKKWDHAVEVSKRDNKDILIILTGKEWCAPCKVLKNNVLKTEQFNEYADSRFVVFEIDLSKSDLSRLNSRTNKIYEEFSEKYNATAFPSLILVNNQGVEKMKITDSTWEFNEVIESFKSVYEY